MSSEPWAVTSLIPGDSTRVPIRWTLSERGVKARRIFLSAFCLMMIAAPGGDVPWQRSTLMRLALVLVRLFEKFGRMVKEEDLAEVKRRLYQRALSDIDDHYPDSVMAEAHGLKDGEGVC